jgi:arylsulfatase A-like enzyme
MEKKRRTPNVILIVIDALRARNLGCYGMQGEPSPYIDKVASEGTLFEKAFSCWNTTDQSLTSILTGKYPRSHGIMNHGDKVTEGERRLFLETGTKLLAQYMKQSGHKTLAVDWMSRWFKQGFDDYGYELDRKGLDRLKYHLVTLPGLYRDYLLGHLPILKLYKPMRKSSPKDLFKGMKDVLSTFAFTFNLAKLQDARFVTQIANDLIDQSRKNPFFLFLHYWDTHTPYYCPKNYLDKTSIHDSKSLLLEKYRGSVKYVDFQLGKLFNHLKENQLWDDTLLIITSDHGDSLTEHDIYFDHHGLYDETTHVPLIMHYPESIPVGKRIESFVQHVDLVPTLCDLFDINCNIDELDGNTLLPIINGDKTGHRNEIFVEESYVQKKSAIRTDDYKYIYAVDNDGWCNYCQKVHVGREELYDLKEDPAELKNIAPKQKELAETMRLELLAKVKFLDMKRQQLRQKYKSQNGELSIEPDSDDEELIKARFKKLGYM